MVFKRRKAETHRNDSAAATLEPKQRTLPVVDAELKTEHENLESLKARHQRISDELGTIEKQKSTLAVQAFDGDANAHDQSDALATKAVVLTRELAGCGVRISESEARLAQLDAERKPLVEAWAEVQRQTLVAKLEADTETRVSEICRDFEDLTESLAIFRLQLGGLFKLNSSRREEFVARIMACHWGNLMNAHGWREPDTSYGGALVLTVRGLRPPA